MNLNEAKVIGVLNRNSKTRDEHLKRNYGKYFQYTENLTPAIGEVYNIDYNRPLYSITDNQPLLEYSHNGNQAYGQLINRKYFNKNREKDIYSVKELNFDQIQAWGGDYTDYITYLDDVLGEDIYSRHVRYINDFLSGQYMENALRQTEVGVVRNINVPIAKQGIITTNPNNLKGLDTPLGTITNYMYSTLLYNGAIFNSDRKSQDKYITRSLINQYGNNLSNVSKLGDMLRVGVGDYELRDDLGADVHIIHSFKDAVGDLNINWMTKNIENAKKYLSEFNEGFSGYELGKEGYVTIEGRKSDDTRFLEINYNELRSGTSFVKTNEKIYADKVYDTYSEHDNAGEEYDSPNQGDAQWEKYSALVNEDNSKTILSKTAKLYNEHKINTLVGRFHTSVDGGISTEQEFIDTAKSRYGNSHGRNLLTKKAQDSETADADDTNGYDNPYCRTWTYHHQYNQVKKLIRPFITVEDNGEAEAMSIESVQMANGKYRAKHGNVKELNGAKYLGDNTVLNKNGFVNICPSGDQNYGSEKGTRIEKCMFSIENLAWKDVPKFTKEKNYISKEQTGPNGGRIMWFPPYDLSFSENVVVGWNESTFIGRGEKVYTYTNTDRTGTLSFTLLIDHPSIVNTYSKLEDGDLSSDIDSDILRYFAGCEIPVIKEPEEKDEKKEKEEDGGVKELENHGEIKFYVYFPNNYSGIVSKAKSKLADNEEDILQYNDNWWAYILAGNNCSLMDEKRLWVGYETTENAGISMMFANDKPAHTEEEKTAIRKTLQEEWIGVAQCYWDGLGDCPGNLYDYTKNDAVDKNGECVVTKSGETAGNWCYRYPVDKDLRQKLGRYLQVPNPQNVSFRDEKSSQLNTYLSDYQKDADYTFGEFIGALIKSEKIKNESIQEIETNDLLEFLKTHGCRENTIEQLSNIISAEGIKYDSITIEGSADQNDAKNADMLAYRRAISIKRLLKGFGIECETFNCSGKKAAEVPDEISNSLKNKLQRFSFVTIKYTLPGTKQALSSMSEMATNKGMTYEEEQEDKNKFNTWFDYLKSYSPLVEEYEKIFDNEDYESSYELFKEDIKTWCINNGVSYDDAESVTEKEWKDIIEKLSVEYKYDYFIPAGEVDGFYSSDVDFLKHLHIHVPINSDSNIDKKISDTNSEMVRLYDESDDYNEKVSALTQELTDLNEEKQEKDLDNKISECDEKISCYIYGNCEDTPSGTTHYQSEIDRITYELDHWTTEKGDKRQLTNEKNKCQREKDKLENKIGKEEVKRNEYQQELNDIDEEISRLTEEIGRYEDKRDEDWRKAGELGKKLDQLRKDKSSGKGLILNKIRSEIYFERFGYNLTDVLKKLKPIDGEFSYNSYNGEKTSLFEISIVIGEDSYFPYNGYDDGEGNIDNSFNKISYPVTISYNRLLKDYFVIKLLDENIENGFEFACDYLMSTQESENKKDTTNDDKSDYEQLKDLLLIQYLLSGEKNKEEENWYISTGGTNANISYYDAWEYMIEHKKDLNITYKPFTDAIDKVSYAIEEYKNPSTSDFDKLINVLTKNTDSVLKYCDTVTEDIIGAVKDYAETAVKEDEKAAEAAAKEKNSQSLKRKYKSECDTLANLKDSVEKKKDQFLYSIFVGSGYTRYETEGEYFEKLDIEHPLIFKSIKEKFKYFNPAFHSMSPEGFNARLNFLHQCTRQGHTYEAKSKNGVTTAHNLAFGRMPVCVLRIGDFINTRIIINNVNISYDNGGMQWDLNPEGVGVQPMYAKVNLGITIIGGQSLNGPISRLQNAVSFDYYANTGVYDNRADRIHIGDDGKIVYDYMFNIKPEKDKYTLYQNATSTAEQANKDTIELAKTNKAQYDQAKNELNDYKLTEGNDQCEK